MLRPTTETEKILYGAPCAHLRLEREVSNSSPVLFAKLPTDVLKAILLGAPLSFFGAIVRVETVAVPITGLKVDDVAGDSFLPFQPVTDHQQATYWADAASNAQLNVSFLNELVIPVIEGSLAIDTNSGKEFAALFSDLTPPSEAIPEATQEQALDVFEQHLRMKGHLNVSGGLTVVSVRATLQSKEVLPLDLETSGDFDLDCADEGAIQEQTLHELLATKFPDSVFRSPKVQDGLKRRELTDLLLLSKAEVFLFESKVMAVLARGLGVTAEKRARRTMQHFQQAIGQLVGTVKNVRKKIPLFAQDGTPLTIDRIEQMDIHALVTVSSANLGLDFHQIADALTNARTEAPAFYHFIDLSELQQHIAFSEDTAQLNAYLQRRFEVTSGSRNAAIRTRFMRKPVKPVNSLPIAATATGYILSFIALPHADHDGPKVVKTLFTVLKEREFSGRFELYHRVLKRRREDYYDLGVGLAWRKGGQKEIPDASWWQDFEARVTSLVGPGLGLRPSQYSGTTTLVHLRRSFESVVVMDMEHGPAVPGA